MRIIPNLTVLSPGCLWEAEQAAIAALRAPGPYYLRVDKSSAGHTALPGEQFAIGKARLLRDGTACTLVATGGILGVVLAAQSALLEEKLACRVISVPTVKPLDRQVLLDAARETGGIITVEEHTIVGGLGGAVAEVLLDQLVMPRFFKRIGLQDTFTTIVGSQEYLREYYEMSEHYIVQEVRRCVAGA